MRKVVKWILLLTLIAGVAYFGMCVFANIPSFNNGGDGSNNPDIADAPYVVVVANTGNVFFTKEYENFGKVLVLHGYWERIGNDFKYRDRDKILDQAIYGIITVRKR